MLGPAPIASTTTRTLRTLRALQGRRVKAAPASGSASGTTSARPPAMTWRDVVDALPAALRYGVHGYVEEAIRCKGEVVASSLGPFPAVFVSRPDLIRHVLVTHKDNYLKDNPVFELLRPLAGNGVFLSDGDFWRSQRRLLQPEFTARAVEAQVDAIADVARAVATAWEASRRADEAVDAGASMRDAAMRVICRTVLGVDLGADAVPLGEALDRLLVLLQVQLSVPHRAAGVVFRALEVPMATAIGTLDAFVEEVVETHRRAHAHGLVHRLLHASDPETGRTMSTRQLRDEVITLFIAGHETTATTLAWSWVELARRPDLLARLAAEADAVIGDGPVRAEHLPRLVFARAVFEEAMRLYPPLPFIPRLAAHDDVLDGRHVGAGTLIVCSVFALHRRPDRWVAPLEFDPSRFLPERRDAVDPAAYAPFGAGPRLCMGNHFALAEGAVILATLAQRFVVALDDPAVGVSKLPGSLRPDRPVRLRLSARARQASPA